MRFAAGAPCCTAALYDTVAAPGVAVADVGTAAALLIPFPLFPPPFAGAVRGVPCALPSCGCVCPPIVPTSTKYPSTNCRTATPRPSSLTPHCRPSVAPLAVAACCWLVFSLPLSRKKGTSGRPTRCVRSGLLLLLMVEVVLVVGAANRAVAGGVGERTGRGGVMNGGCEEAEEATWWPLWLSSLVGPGGL